MTIAHLAGVNTTPIATATEGHPILMSYASVIDSHGGVVEKEILPRLRAGMYPSAVLDSGAFTELSQPGFHVSVEQYTEWACEHGHLFNQIIGLDDIGGNLERTFRNNEVMVKAGLSPVPVFHGGGEPFEVLHHYCATFNQVGLGFARVPTANGARINTSPGGQGHGLDHHQWLTRCLDITELYPEVQVHGFGMTRYATNYAFGPDSHDRMDTSDSTTWLAEFKALNGHGGSGDTLGNGLAAELLQGLDRVQRMKIAAASYMATGGDPGIEEVVADSRGQARTCLRRFSVAELEKTIATLQ